MRKRSKWIAAIFVFAVFLFGGAAQRQYTIGRDALAASEEALRNGNMDAAVANSRRAASAYVPGADHVARGFESLASIAHSAEVRGDERTALLAYNAIRSAALQSQGILGPSPWYTLGSDGIVRVGSSRSKGDQHPDQATLAYAVNTRHGPSAAIYLLVSGLLVLFLATAAWMFARTPASKTGVPG